MISDLWTYLQYLNTTYRLCNDGVHVHCCSALCTTHMQQEVEVCHVCSTGTAGTVHRNSTGNIGTEVKKYAHRRKMHVTTVPVEHCGRQYKFTVQEYL